MDHAPDPPGQSARELQPAKIGDPNQWLWRVTWRKNTAYSIGYDTAAEKFMIWYDDDCCTVAAPSVGASCIFTELR